jgi:hypothetical protein
MKKEENNSFKPRIFRIKYTTMNESGKPRCRNATRIYRKTVQCIDDEGHSGRCRYTGNN